MPSKRDTSLATGLSQVLVAYVIELDNEFEEQFARAGGGARVVSVAMWSNLLRFVGDGIAVGELSAAVGTPTSRVLSTLAGMERWRYVALATGQRGSAGGGAKREGFGSARGLESSWIVRPTSAGRTAEVIWRTLFDDIDVRWSERFGDDAIDELRSSLRAIGAELDADFPDALPILSGGNGMLVDLPTRSRDAAADPHLYALLSRALLAYAVDFQRESPLSLALCANVVRVLGEKGLLVRDIPDRSGISKEATSMALTSLVRSGHVVVDGTTAATRLARLTPAGREVRALSPALHAELEKQWSARFGGDAVRRLGASLDRLLGLRDGALAVLSKGLEPYPEGWRASKPYVARTLAVIEDPTARLPHSPMVLHRGGWPDGF